MTPAASTWGFSPRSHENGEVRPKSPGPSSGGPSLLRGPGSRADSQHFHRSWPSAQSLPAGVVLLFGVGTWCGLYRPPTTRFAPTVPRSVR